MICTLSSNSVVVNFWGHQNHPGCWYSLAQRERQEAWSQDLQISSQVVTAHMSCLPDCSVSLNAWWPGFIYLFVLTLMAHCQGHLGQDNHSIRIPVSSLHLFIHAWIHSFIYAFNINWLFTMCLYMRYSSEQKGQKFLTSWSLNSFGSGWGRKK